MHLDSGTALTHHPSFPSQSIAYSGPPITERADKGDKNKKATRKRTAQPESHAKTPKKTKTTSDDTVLFKGNSGVIGTSNVDSALPRIVPRACLDKVKADLGVERMLAESVVEIRAAMADFVHR